MESSDFGALARKSREEYLASEIDEALAERFLERMIGRMIDVNCAYDDLDPGRVYDSLTAAPAP